MPRKGGRKRRKKQAICHSYLQHQHAPRKIITISSNNTHTLIQQKRQNNDVRDWKRAKNTVHQHYCTYERQVTAWLKPNRALPLLFPYFLCAFFFSSSLALATVIRCTHFFRRWYLCIFLLHINIQIRSCSQFLFKSRHGYEWSLIWPCAP